MDAALSYTIAGLVLGGIYALSASGVVLTFRSTGILNFAFGALAYLVARFYYFLNTQHGWPTWQAALLAVCVVGPALGVALWAVLFRTLQHASALVKVVATIGLAVAVPPLTTLVLGNAQIYVAPGLAPQPVRVFHVLEAAVTLDQLISYVCILAVLAGGALLLHYTDIGLRVRATVDSEAMTALSGTNVALVSIGVWASSSLMAGLAGVLIAPVIGLQPNSYTLLVAAAFAAVVAARLDSLAVATLVGLLMGVVSSLAQGYLPSGTYTSAIVPSIPFLFIVFFLLYHRLRSGWGAESAQLGSTLDRAIRTQTGAPGRERAAPAAGHRRRFALHDLGSPSFAAAIAVAGVAVLPLFLSSFWRGLVGLSVAYAVVFLGYTLVTGQGGMIWLCQITLAGVGAITTAQLAGRHGWPVLLAIAAGGGVAALMGLGIGLLTISLGNLYVALVTLTFGLLMETLVFRLDAFYKAGAGVSLGRPGFASSDLRFTYLALVVFCAFALFIANLRRSTTGLALGAVRTSDAGSRTMGISVLRMKLLVAGFGAAVAGVGGGLLACYAQATVPDAYATLAGMTWLAVVVTIGIRSSTAALVAGLAFAFFPAFFLFYLPGTWAQVPVALFGVGAILVARNPDGVLGMYGRLLRSGISLLVQARQAGAAASGSEGHSPGPVG